MNKFEKLTLSIALAVPLLSGCSSNILKTVESLNVEFGTPISTDVVYYLSEDIKKEDKEKLLANTKVEILEDEKVEGKEYQHIGEYTVKLSYEDETSEVKVTVKDTVKPVFKNFKESINTYKDVKIDFTKSYKAEDLDNVTIISNDSQVDYTKVGNYKATVTATDESGNAETKEVTVNINKPTIKLDETSKNMYINESFVLKANVKGKNTKATFKSSDTAIATVTETGKVTAKKKGTAIIIVSANDIKAECKITVKGAKPVSTIKDSTNPPNQNNNKTDKPNHIENEPVKQEPYVANLNASKKYNKIIIISTSGASSSKGTFEYFKKKNGSWKKELTSTAQLGSRGINKVKEGDKKTPTGLYTFTKVMGIASNPGTKMPYHKIDGNDYWCGGKNYYNQFIDEDVQTHDCDKKNDEKLIKYNTPYQYLAALNYNHSNIYGKGSAIFLHCNTNSGSTLGCIAINKSHMKRIIKEIDSSTCIIIDLKKNISKY